MIVRRRRHRCAAQFGMCVDRPQHPLQPPHARRPSPSVSVSFPPRDWLRRRDTEPSGTAGHELGLHNDASLLLTRSMPAEYVGMSNGCRMMRRSMSREAGQGEATPRGDPGDVNTRMRAAPGRSMQRRAAGAMGVPGQKPRLASRSSTCA
jgi:hypothetical protein